MNLSYKQKKIYIVVFAAVIVVIFSHSLLLRSNQADIVFNQNIVEGWRNHFDAASVGERMRGWWSAKTAMWNVVFGTHNEIFDANDIDSTFRFVLEHVPPYAVIYPSQGYYYFKIPSKDIAGNIRFSDVQKNEVSFAYYDISDPHGESKHTMYGPENGLEIKKNSESSYTISYDGIHRTFKLPVNWEKMPKGFELLPDEVFDTVVTDESGVKFVLIFNEKHRSFYYVLDESLPVMDHFYQVSDDVLVGKRTSFAFYDDKETGRKILFGVSTQEIMKNNYYDGPFDQIPAQYEFRDHMYAAYPYTQYMNGLDPHGNFIDFPGTEVSIAPYLNYLELTELTDLVSDCSAQSGSEKWACLTYESKKDFHKTIPEFFNADGTKK